jgi:hypothetical protein
MGVVRQRSSSWTAYGRTRPSPRSSRVGSSAMLLSLGASPLADEYEGFVKQLARAA